MMNKIAHGFMEVANTDDGKTIIYIVVCEEDLSSIECTGTFIWKEKLLCKLQGNRFFCNTARQWGS